MSYPLEQLHMIKKRRLEEAERELKLRREELVKEEKTLREKEAERDTAKKHKAEKLRDLRADMDKGEGPDKIEQGKKYLEIVDLDLAKKVDAVKAQEQKVETAKQAVEKARENMLQKQRDVEKLDEHKKAWKIEMRKEEQHQESIVSDELGTAMFNLKKRGKKRG